MNNNREIRERFIKDLKLSIPVIESPYFEFYLDLYEKDWNAKSDYNRLIGAISKNQHFLADFYKVRDKMIQYIKSQESFNKFNTCDIHSLYGNPKFANIRSNAIYNEEFAGGIYISLDLKKANIQSLRYWDPDMFIKDDSLWIDEVWEKWVEYLCEEDIDLAWYIKKSKYIRQVVFGNCNPKRQITLERWMVGEGANEFIKMANISEDKVIYASTDEVILKVDKLIDKDELQGISDLVFKEVGVELRAQSFKLESISYLNGAGETIRLYKKLYSDGTVDYKGVSKHYFPQIYMDQNGIDPDPQERDLVFYQEKDLAKFLKRLCRS